MLSARRISAVGMLLLVIAPSALRSRARGAASGTAEHTIEWAGSTRTYLLHLPAKYDGRRPLPLVMVLHGATQSPESAEKMSAMSTKGDQESFIAVYPKGTGRLPTWNSGACCAYAMENHIDDVGFLRALIEKLERENAVDPRRVYVTGISNGAMMSYRLACELSEKVAAISPVEGSQDIACTPSSPVSVLVFHGTADRLVPFDGGSTPYQMGSKRSDTPVLTTVAFWVKENGCAAAPKHEETSEVKVDMYSGCRNGTAVQLYAIQGGHHIWPGLAISGNHVPASDLMWTFFSEHPKQ